MKKLAVLVASLLLAAVLAVKAAPHSVTLKWQPSTTSGVGYLVFRGSSVGGEAQITSAPVASGCSGSTCSFVDSNVTAGSTYYYYVESTDGTNNSSSSNEIKVTIPVNPVSNVTIIQAN